MRWSGDNKFLENRADLVSHKFHRQRPDHPEVAQHRSHKDTKRWCRGKVGVKHKWARYGDRWYIHDVCTVCGKRYLPKDYGIPT